MQRRADAADSYRRIVFVGMAEPGMCTHQLIRTRRTALERVIYSEAFHCPKCDGRIKRLHPLIEARISFYVSRYTRCIRCANPRIHRLHERDRLDSMSKSPTSQLMRVTGAPLNKCNIC